MQQTRVPTRVHTRELDRGIARTQMKRIGMKRFCKHDYYGRPWERVYTNSYFANHWREYSVGGKNKKEEN